MSVDDPDDKLRPAEGPSTHGGVRPNSGPKAADERNTTSYQQYAKARAHREFIRAKQDELKLKQREGMVVDREAAADACYQYGKHITRSFDKLASRIAVELASMSDPWQIEQFLRAVFLEEIKHVTEIPAMLAAKKAGTI